MDQIGEERNRTREGEDRDLRSRGEGQHAEADRDRLDSLTGADDRAIDEPVRMAMTVAMGVIVTMLFVMAVVIFKRLRPLRKGEVAVGPARRVGVDVLPMPMQNGVGVAHSADGSGRS